MKEYIQYNSIDLLKFIMALLVVMIHVQPNRHSETLSEIFNNLTSIAVPVFFVISSMFVFHKVNGGHFCLLSYCKRIGLLYLCWFLIFFFHFSIAGKIGLFTAIVGDTLLTNWLYYLIVIVISVLFAEIVLRLEKTKYLFFLRFLH